MSFNLASVTGEWRSLYRVTTLAWAHMSNDNRGYSQLRCRPMPLDRLFREVGTLVAQHHARWPRSTGWQP